MGTEWILLNMGVTWAMFGLIWLVQLILYPAFAKIAEEEFIAFHRMHTSRISWIVFPLMTTELVLAVLILLSRPNDPVWLLNAAFVLFLWASTVFIQIPIHRILAAGKDLDAIRRLCKSNWWRTAAWTLKSALAIWVLL